MSTTLITACTGIPSEEDLIVVSDMARPHLERWMAENGYVRRDQALRDRLAHTPPPFVPVIEDVA